MVDYEKIKEYTWILLVIAAIFAILSLCIPLSLKDVSNRYFWMAGFYYDTDTASFGLFSTYTWILLVVAMIIAIILLLAAVISIKLEKLNTKLIRLGILASCVLLLIVPIGYYVANALRYTDWFSAFFLQFGFVAPIIAFIIALPCVFLIKDRGIEE